MTLDLDRLSRADLEALASYKLWEEMRIGARDSKAAIAAADRQWLTAFLKLSGERIAHAAFDGALLVEARGYYHRFVQRAAA